MIPSYCKHTLPFALFGKHAARWLVGLSGGIYNPDDVIPMLHFHFYIIPLLSIGWESQLSLEFISVLWKYMKSAYWAHLPVHPDFPQEPLWISSPHCVWSLAHISLTTVGTCWCRLSINLLAETFQRSDVMSSAARCTLPTAKHTLNMFWKGNKEIFSFLGTLIL